MANSKPEAIERDRRRLAPATPSVRSKPSDRAIARYRVRRGKLRALRPGGQVWGALAVAVIIAVGTRYIAKSVAENATGHQGPANGDAAPIYGIEIPPGYRDWRLISVKRLASAAGDIRQLRAELANDIAADAFRDGRLPFPDGSIIAALHWNEAASDADNKVLAEGFPGVGLKSTFAGSAANVQFMVKDAKKYAATGGWGFADFTNGKPGDQALHEKCFPCHQPAKDRDFVFTRYAPTP